MQTEIERTNVINLNDIEDIDFMPINEGLGFNPNTAKEVLVNANKAQKVKVDRPIKKIYNEVLNYEPELSTKSVPRELEAFYSSPVETESRVDNTLVFNKANQEASSYFVRLLSWLIDFSSVAFVFIVIHTLMYISTSLSANEFVSLLRVNVAFPVLMFIFIYNICSLMRGEGRSLGQSILGVETISRYRDNSPLAFLVLKANFELVSLFLLGLPFLMNFDQKLFDNKTVAV